MSGIAAIYDQAGARVSADELAPLLEAISHRGPREGVWLGDCVALGQRLLPCTPEAEAERLPVRAAGGNFQMALDGRIDNRDDLAAALGADFDAALMTDADLIIHAYHRWDTGCLERLVGDFAFVLWDRRQGRLFAARDQRGFRPLVYARRGERLVLGSEPRQILAYPGLPARVDQLFLACHLTGAPPPLGATPYEAVSEVPPAHYLIAKGSSVSVREYWRLEPRPTLGYRRRQEYVDHFDETFGKAVRSALRAKRPAVLLSGGLDSSYILAHAATAGTKVSALTAFVSGSPKMDERQYSRAVGESLGVPVEEVAVDDCWSLSCRYLPDSAFDQPSLPVQAPLILRMAQAARAAGVDVLIDGIGGDECMAGSSDYLARLILAGQWLRAAEEARAWSREAGLSQVEVLTRAALVPMLPRVLRARYRALTGRTPLSPLPRWIDRAALKSLGLEQALELPPPNSAWGRRAALRSFWSFHRSEELPVLGWRERQASLPLGLDTRSPFWDLRVLDLILRTPAWVHRRGGQPKALLRDAMRPRLPREVVDRNDKGVFELLVTGLIDRERERVETALGSGPLTELAYVKEFALSTELEAYRSHRHPWWHSLWRAITAGLWLRLDVVSRGHIVDRLVRI